MSIPEKRVHFFRPTLSGEEAFLEKGPSGDQIKAWKEVMPPEIRENLERQILLEAFNRSKIFPNASALDNYYAVERQFFERYAPACFKNGQD